MSMCSRGPWGGPFTGVSKLRLFLLWREGLEEGDSVVITGWGRGFAGEWGLRNLYPEGRKGEGRREEAAI